MFIETFCEYPFNRIRLTCEGNLSFCCFMRPDPSRPESEAYLGNILETNFDDIWFGEKAESVRQSTLEGKLHTLCQCPGCPILTQSMPYAKKEIVYNEYPTFLEIDLPNTHCNIGGLRPDPVRSPACIMCERSSPHFRPENNRLFEVLEKIKYVVPNLNQIHIQGIAEPFYETREEGCLLFDVLDALEFSKHSQRITLSVTTNGTLFKKSIRQRYLNIAPNSITTFSLDSATPETFKKIRIIDCFDKVISNLNEFGLERNRSKQFLKIHNNINMLNVHEVKGMVHIAHRAKVECVEFNPTNGFYTSILVNERNCGLFAKAQQEIIDECRLLKVQPIFPRPLDLGLTEQLIQITL